MSADLLQPGAARYLARLRRVPVLVWIVVAMMTATTVYQYPTYGINRPARPGETATRERDGVPMVRECLPLLPYALGTGLLILGTALGARWAFVVNVVTVWIFPLETAMGIKGTLHGSTLSVLHVIAVILLGLSWRYFWKRPQ